MTATSLEAAETVSVRVVAQEDPSRGVQSWIALDVPGQSPSRHRTSRNGTATLSVIICDETLGIYAEPNLPYLNTARFDCSRDLQIPVEKARYAAAVEPALRQAAASAIWVKAQNLDKGGGFFDGIIAGLQLPGRLPYAAPDPHVALVEALDDLRYAEAAQSAGGLAMTARRRGDDALAASYEAVAAAAGFRALGREPGDPAQPLLVSTPAGPAALTPAGRAVVSDFQQRSGLEPTGIWSPGTFRALPERDATPR